MECSKQAMHSLHHMVQQQSFAGAAEVVIQKCWHFNMMQLTVLDDDRTVVLVGLAIRQALLEVSGFEPSALLSLV